MIQKSSKLLWAIVSLYIIEDGWGLKDLNLDIETGTAICVH